MKLLVSQKDHGLRLDKFLVNKFPEFSRIWLQKLIKEGEIKVNNKKVKPSYILKIKDEIIINFKKPPEISLEPDSKIKIDIIYEDKDILVANKPAGLVVHPSPTIKFGTFVNGLLAIRPEIRNVGDFSAGSGQANLRPGILHRLDKETSGLLIVAKNNTAFLFFKNQFKKRKIIKKYYALVAGEIEKNEFSINLPIIRSKSDPTKQKVIISKKDPLFLKARPAQTKIKVLKRFSNYTLIEAQPITGRMHQIRVHLSAIGYPVVGDEKYGRKYKKQFLGLKRNFLHAYYLKFKLLSGKFIELKLDLPEELKNILKLLESKF